MWVVHFISWERKTPKCLWDETCSISSPFNRIICWKRSKFDSYLLFCVGNSEKSASWELPRNSFLTRFISIRSTLRMSNSHVNSHSRNWYILYILKANWQPFFPARHIFNIKMAMHCWIRFANWQWDSPPTDTKTSPVGRSTAATGDRKRRQTASRALGREKTFDPFVVLPIIYNLPYLPRNIMRFFNNNLQKYRLNCAQQI